MVLPTITVSVDIMLIVLQIRIVAAGVTQDSATRTRAVHMKFSPATLRFSSNVSPYVPFVTRSKNCREYSATERDCDNKHKFSFCQGVIQRVKVSVQVHCGHNAMLIQFSCGIYLICRSGAFGRHRNANTRVVPRSVNVCSERLN